MSESSKKNLEDAYPLTPMQEGLLFQSAYEPERGAYLEQFSCIIRGAFQVAHFQAAWERVVQRHPVMRTAFAWKNTQKPLQVTAKKTELPFRVEELQGLGAAEKLERRRELMMEDRQQGFDLSRPPLFRVMLLLLGEGELQFVLTNHHIVLDGWSRPLLLKDVFENYRALVAGKAEVPGAAPTPFKTYVNWINSHEPQGAQAFFEKALAGAGVGPTPLPETGPAGVPGEIKILERVLSPEVSGALRETAARERIPLNTLLQGAWALLLSRFSGRGEVVFGVTLAGRSPELEGFESMVGLFINTLPFCVRVDEGDSLSEYLGRVREDFLELQAFEFVSPALVYKWSGLTGRRPLYESVLVFENVPPGSLDAGGEFEFREPHLDSRAHFPLTGVLVPGDSLGMQLHFQSDRFSSERVQLILDSFALLLEQFSRGGEQRLRDLNILTPEQNEDLIGLGRGAGPGNSPGVGATPCAVFEERVGERPDAVALSFGEESLSYSELNSRATALAAGLAGRGVGPGSVVGICLERSSLAIVALLAVLKAGGTYLPLDPDYPRERLSFMTEDAGAGLVLGEEAARDKLPDCVSPLEIMAEASGDAGAGTALGALEISPESAAYIIYTSGSTGRPRGVKVSRRALLELFASTGDSFGLGPDDVWTLFHSISFDFSVWEIWGALLYGGRLRIVEHDVSRDPGRFLELLKTDGVTVLNQTPSAFYQLLNQDDGEGLEQLRLVIFGGEALNPAALKPWVEKRGLERPKLANMYGITETVVHASLYFLSPEDLEQGQSPIGVGIPGKNLYLLDELLRPTPPGAIGEIYVAGLALADGYLNRPAGSGERFMPDPFVGEAGARMYRSGDLARFLPEGGLEYLGRADRQVQVRGFRIEPGEIEAAILKGGVFQEVAVLPYETSDGTRLAAYVVAPEKPEAEELRRQLSDSLATHMLPSCFIFLDALPLTANGKLDQAALPDPAEAREARAGRGALPPETETERKIAGIWCRVLELDVVGRGDDFFLLGGDSIRAVRIAAGLRKEFKVELSLGEMFKFPRLMDMAEWVDSLLWVLDSPTPNDVSNKKLEEVEF